MLRGYVVNNKYSFSSTDFLDYFQSINDPDSVFFQPDEDVSQFNKRYVQGELDVMFSELNALLVVNDIIKACKQLINGKSAGPDYFINESFKYGIKSDVFARVICTLLNKLFDCSYVPESWSDGFIVPLHEKGDVNIASNYTLRITLLSTFGKLFTKVINDRLTVWGECYSVYIEAQAGFRKHNYVYS